MPPRTVAVNPDVHIALEDVDLDVPGRPTVRVIDAVPLRVASVVLLAGGAPDVDDGEPAVGVLPDDNGDVVAHDGRVMTLVSSVSAPLQASTLPCTVAALLSVIDVSAITVP